MALGQTPTRRIQVTLSVQMHDYLAAIVRTGMYGSSVVDVARNLVEDGVRRAIEKDFIQKVVLPAPE
jgi:Arc/MetJ-type ribon-helix-helix transcriptional regulator